MIWLVKSLLRIVKTKSSDNLILISCVASKSIDSYIPSDLKKEFKYINYNYKHVMIHPITDKPIYFLADMPPLVKKNC